MHNKERETHSKKCISIQLKMKRKMCDIKKNLGRSWSSYSKRIMKKILIQCKPIVTMRHDQRNKIEREKMELNPWFIMYSLMLNDPVNNINERLWSHRVREYHVTNDIVCCLGRGINNTQEKKKEMMKKK